MEKLYNDFLNKLYLNVLTKITQVLVLVTTPVNVFEFIFIVIQWHFS